MATGAGNASASTTLAQQIRAFNQQQFTASSRADVSPVDALLASDSDEPPPLPAAAATGSDTDDLQNDDDDDSDDSDELDDEKAALVMMSTLQLLQARGHQQQQQTPSTRHRKKKAPVAHAELAHAEERVAALEAQLLDAEETICHLKAEKLAALRSVEKLTLALQAAATAATARGPDEQKSVNIWRMPSSSSAEDEDDGERPETLSDDGDNNREADDEESEGATADELRAKVRQLQARLSAQQQSRELEQEERMAVIREQEREIQKLKLELERMAETCEDLDARLFRAFDATSPASLAATARRRASRADSTGDVDGDSALLMRTQSVSSLRERRRRSLSLDSGDSGDARSESSDSVGTAPISSSSSSSENPGMQWREELVRHPTPHFDLDSPEVQYLLHAWTTNLQKLQYLRLWLTQVATTRGPLAPDFPRGVELPRLLPEIRDGFLVLVVPLLRKQTQRDVHVHSRPYSDQFHTDLRIRVTPRT